MVLSFRFRGNERGDVDSRGIPVPCGIGTGYAEGLIQGREVEAEDRLTLPGDCDGPAVRVHLRPPYSLEDQSSRSIW